jgi:hypothetical protein
VRAAVAALPWHLLFKATLFALLACNAAILFIAGTVSEALDASAWLVLLALFELETGHGSRLRGRYTAAVIHAIRIAAAAAVSAAAVGYVYDREWLDATNSTLWIAVVILLEVEVRYPLAVGQHRVAFVAAASALYSGLAALVLVWAWRGQWFDAYDALLWLIAFATIEINVLQIFRAPGLAGESTSGSG